MSKLNYITLQSLTIIKYTLTNNTQMTKVIRTCQGGIRVEDLKGIYEKRLNSLADTFLMLLNNLENNNLFKQLQAIHLLQNINQFGLYRISQYLSTHRTQYLKSVIQASITQNQQKTIKKLEIQNISLKAQKQYYSEMQQHKPPAYRDSVFRNVQNQPLFQQNQANYWQCQSHKESPYELQQYHRLNQKGKYFLNKAKKKDHGQPQKRKLIKGANSQLVQSSKQSFKVIDSSQTTSFVVPFRDNDSDYTQRQLVSSIEPHSQVSSIPSSEKRRGKEQADINTNKGLNVCALSLREQLQKLNKNTKMQYKKVSPIKQNKKSIKNTRNYKKQKSKQNQEYDFKYLKI